MHRATAAALLTLFSVGVAGCKKRIPATSDRDAGTPTTTTTIAATTTTSAVAPGRDASLIDAQPLPESRGNFELVAVGKGWGTKILWLSVHGSRVWLSGRNVDAVADGDGPLVKVPDPLKDLPYEPGKHSLRMAGLHPHLYVLRLDPTVGRARAANAVAFVRHGDDKWVQAKPLKNGDVPVAFLPWGEGALVVDSQDGPGGSNGNPGYAADRGPGTELHYIAPDGTVSDPKELVIADRRFVAWSADSDGTSLALLGTTIQQAAPSSDPTYGIHVVRGDAKAGGLKDTLLFSVKEFGWQAMYRARIREQGAGGAGGGGSALAIPPDTNNELEAWKPNAQTAYAFEGGGAFRQASIPRRGDICGMRDALLVDGALLAIDACFDSPTQLVRVAGKTIEKVTLPSLVKESTGGFRAAKSDEKNPSAIACNADKLVLRAPNDLWVRATCGGEGGIAAVFRRARAGGGSEPARANEKSARAQDSVVILP